MGGAGLALVDDGAATRLNPARLAAINDPDLVLQIQGGAWADRSYASGFAPFDPSANPFAGATVDGRFATHEGVAAGHIAFAWPMRVLSRPLVIGVSRSDPADLTVDAQTASRTWPLSAPQAPPGGDEVVRISRGRLDAQMVLYDLAAGMRLTPTFEIGAGITAGRLDLSSRTTGSLADPLQFTGPGAADPRYAGTTPAALARTTSSGGDTDLGYLFGVWWKPGRAVSLATVYRQGLRFGVPARSRDDLTGASASFTNRVRQPDTAALGVAWTPFWASPSAILQGLTFALDLERVKYADLLEGMRAGENVMTRSDFLRDADYEAADATEAHLGIEYRQSFTTWSLALRGGAYNRHDGGPFLDSADGDVGALQGQGRALEASEFFRPQGDDYHGTLGIGATFDSFSIDAALDFSHDIDRLIVSSTWRLGRP